MCRFGRLGWPAEVLQSTGAALLLVAVASTKPVALTWPLAGLSTSQPVAVVSYAGLRCLNFERQGFVVEGQETSEHALAPLPVPA